MSASSPKIFFVEDDEVLLGLLSQILIQNNYQLTSFQSSLKADQAIDQIMADAKNGITDNLPDLFLLDFSMPGVSGEVLYKKIRRVFKTIPILILSGYYPEHMEQITDDNLKILSKPIVTKSLLLELSSLIKKIKDPK